MSWTQVAEQLPTPPYESNAIVHKDAPPPFNKPVGNVILRTVDLVDFRVREGILAEASSFFEDMFTLPALPADRRKRKERDDQEYRDGIPVVPVSETARTLNNLLRFCYPVANPEMRSADEVCEALDASRKYLMEQAEKDIKCQFAAQAERCDPLKLYAFAARRSWKEEMRIAAMGCLLAPFPVGTWVPEMELVGAGTYMRLQVYHKACAEAAEAAVLQEWVAGGEQQWHCPAMTSDQTVWFTCRHQSPTPYPPSSNSIASARKKKRPSQSFLPTPPRSKFHVAALARGIYAAPWILEYLEDLATEVQACPRGATVLKSALNLRYTTLVSQQCTVCALRVSGDLNDLRQSLASAVEAAVVQVSDQMNQSAATKSIPCKVQLEVKE